MPKSDGDGWPAVGRAIAERIKELGVTKAEVIRRSGVSDTSLDAYIGGQPIKRPDKLHGLCEALRWTPDSIELIRAGKKPIVTLPAVGDQVLARLDENHRLLVEILEELRGRPG